MAEVGAVGSLGRRGGCAGQAELAGCGRLNWSIASVAQCRIPVPYGVAPGLRAKGAGSGSDPRSDARKTVVLYGRSWVRAGGVTVIPAAGRHFPTALRPLPRQAC